MDQAIHQSKKHILVVDDNSANLLLTDRVLTSYYRVSCVDSGDACLDLMEKDPADLILMDVGMPNMDGFECCQRLRAMPNFKSLPILFLTCQTNPGAELKGMEVGGTEYITRPCDIKLVMERIEHHLNGG
jgi:putative two-component system response regulator